MQCPICTSTIPDGVDVCQTCGYQVKKQPVQPNYNVQTQGNTQQNVYEQMPVNRQQGYYEQVPGGRTPMYNGAQAGKSNNNKIEADKKKSKLPLIIACISLVVLCGLGVGAYFLFFAEKDEKESSVVAKIEDTNTGITETVDVVEEPEIDEEIVEEIDDSSHINTTIESKLIEIDGVKYLEIPFAEDADRLGYSVGDYGGVTLYSEILETTDELELSDDGNTANFVAVVSHDGTMLGKVISVDLTEEPYQLGNTDIMEFSKHYKEIENENTGLTIKFGRAYYDYESTLYVDILIVNFDVQADELVSMYTHTAKIDLTIE